MFGVLLGMLRLVVIRIVFGFCDDDLGVIWWGFLVGILMLGFEFLV